MIIILQDDLSENNNVIVAEVEGACRGTIASLAPGLLSILAY